MRGTTTAALWVGLLCAGFAGTAHAQNVTFTIRLRAELEVRNPELPSQPLGPLPLVEERLRAEIDGQHATSELVQVFRNQTGARLEGRYVLRPTMDARVQGFAYYVGEERIVGEVLERQAARQVYEQVTQARRDPAILEQTADGEFTFRVFPIEPGESKRIETTFGEWLSRRGSTVTYRVPLASRDASAEVIVRDPRARQIRSPTHAIAVEPIEGGVRVRARRATDATGELILRWEIEERPWTSSAWVHRDDGHSGYFVLSLAAPDGFEDRVSAKDVTLVLDRSGSMQGDPIVHAREAAADIIRRLGNQDRLNVLAFDDDVEPLFTRPQAVNAEVRADALEFVARLSPGGGTDIAFALRRALEGQEEGAARPRVVIFLTDGQSAPGPALDVAQRDERDVRVFAVGLGSGVNRALLSRLSAIKRGTFTFIDRASMIESEVGHLYAQIARPLLVGVSLEVEGAVASQLYPRSMPDLFVDDELVVTGRFRGDQPSFVLRGTLGGRPVEVRTTAAPEASGRRPWVGRRWATRRVDHLLEEIELGGDRPELREEVVSLALAYDFVTPFTAFLAIPERELTAGAANVLAQARGQRVDAQARHQDAVALQTFSSGASGGGGDEAGEPMMESNGDMSPPMAMRSGGGMPGCASCAVGASRPTPRGLVLLPLFAMGLLLRRKRSSRRA